MADDNFGRVGVQSREEDEGEWFVDNGRDELQKG